MYPIFRQKYLTSLIPKTQPQLCGNIERVDFININSKKFVDKVQNEKTAIIAKTVQTDATKISEAASVSNKENTIAVTAKRVPTETATINKPASTSNTIAAAAKTVPTETAPINEPACTSDKENPIAVAASVPTEAIKTSEPVNINDNKNTIAAKAPVSPGGTEKAQSSISNSEMLLNTLTIIATSNEVKLVKLSSIRAYKWTRDMFQQHVLDNPKVKAYVAELKKKMESQDKKKP